MPSSHLTHIPLLYRPEDLENSFLPQSFLILIWYSNKNIHMTTMTPNSLLDEFYIIILLHKNDTHNVGMTENQVKKSWLSKGAAFISFSHLKSPLHCYHCYITLIMTISQLRRKRQSRRWRSCHKYNVSYLSRSASCLKCNRIWQKPDQTEHDDRHRKTTMLTR